MDEKVISTSKKAIIPYIVYHSHLYQDPRLLVNIKRALLSNRILIFIHDTRGLRISRGVSCIVIHENTYAKFYSEIHDNTRQ
jgi:hypothetical protein